MSKINRSRLKMRSNRLTDPTGTLKELFTGPKGGSTRGASKPPRVAPKAPARKKQ